MSQTRVAWRPIDSPPEVDYAIRVLLYIPGYAPSTGWFVPQAVRIGGHPWTMDGMGGFAAERATHWAYGLASP